MQRSNLEIVSIALHLYTSSSSLDCPYTSFLSRVYAILCDVALNRSDPVGYVENRALCIGSSVGLGGGRRRDGMPEEEVALKDMGEEVRNKMCLLDPVCVFWWQFFLLRISCE